MLHKLFELIDLSMEQEIVLAWSVHHPQVHKWDLSLKKLSFNLRLVLRPTIIIFIITGITGMQSDFNIFLIDLKRLDPDPRGKRMRILIWNTGI